MTRPATFVAVIAALAVMLGLSGSALASGAAGGEDRVGAFAQDSELRVGG